MEAGHGPPGFGTGLDEEGDESMRPGRREPRGFVPIAWGCVPGVAATLTLGACSLETIVGPEEAVDAPAAMDGNEATASSEGTAAPGKETDEVPAVAGDEAPEGSWGTTKHTCRRPSRISPADMPLIIVDGVRSEPCFDAIAALDIESFEIIKGSRAVKIYGEDAKHGAIVIFTKRPDGRGNGGGTPGRPPG